MTLSFPFSSFFFLVVFSVNYLFIYLFNFFKGQTGIQSNKFTLPIAFL